MTQYNGVLPVDKPIGPTSHDVVAIARRSLGMRRIGHTGTLDPFASGLLLLCLGASTRLAEYLTDLPKSYLGTLRLGVSTDTDDREGSMIGGKADLSDLQRDQVDDAFAWQIGVVMQVPPRYSAKKVNGTRLYSAARRGEVVEVDPVQVRIEGLRILRYALPDIDFEVDCSSGTYVRAIARDIGEELGVGAHLTALRRTRIGDHVVQRALTLDQLDSVESVGKHLIQPAEAVAHLDRFRATTEQVERLKHGGSLDPSEEEFVDVASGSLPIAVVDRDGSLVAIAERSGSRLRPRKVFS